MDIFEQLKNANDKDFLDYLKSKSKFLSEMEEIQKNKDDSSPKQDQKK